MLLVEQVGSALMEIAVASTGAKISTEKPGQIADKLSIPSSNHATLSAVGHQNSDKVLTSPAVRKIAKENRIDLTQVVGTGPKGRILKEDVLKFLQSGGVSQAKPKQVEQPFAQPAAAPVVVVQPAPGTSTRVPIKGIQKQMVKSMRAALQVPHFGYKEEVSRLTCSVRASRSNNVTLLILDCRGRTDSTSRATQTCS